MSNLPLSQLHIQAISETEKQSLTASDLTPTQLTTQTGEALYPKTKASNVIDERGITLEDELTNPTTTLTHSDFGTSFKVDEAAVDSFLTNFTIKGQTYQNILPDPTLRNEMRGKSMQRLNEGYDNIEVVDGISKSAVLKGQTLVNLATQKSGDFSGGRFIRIPLSQTLENGKKYIVKLKERNSTLPNGFNVRFRIGENGNTTGTISLNTPYIVSVDGLNRLEFFTKNADDTTNGYDATLDEIMVLKYQEGMENWDIPYFEGMQSVNLYPDQKVSKITWKSGQYYNDNGELTTANANQNHRYFDEYVEIHPNHVYTISGNNNYKNLNFYDANKNHVLKVSGKSLWGDGSVKDDLYATAPTNAKYMRYNMAIGSNMNEGTTIFDTTLGIPLMKTSITETYFHKMPVLTTTGKNVFDGKFIKYNSTYGQYHFGNGIYTYSITDNDVSVDLRGVSFGDAVNGATSINWLINNGNAYGNKRTITNRNLVFYPNNEETFNKIKQRYNIQIEQGSVATSYEPYKTNILQTPEEVVLKGLPNGVTDTLNINTGEYVQRIGEVVLDGSDNGIIYKTYSTNNEGYSVFQCTIPASIYGERKYGGKWMSTFPMGSPNASDWKDKEYVGGNWYGATNMSNVYVIKLLTSSMSSNDVNGFKEYLQQNPITIQYELATPVMKTVDLSSSGNWEKVVLDGSESITMVQSNRLFQIRKTVVGIPVSNQTGDNPYILTETPSFNTWGLDTYNNYNSSKANSICYHREIFFIQLEKEGSVEEMVSRLQQKPLVIWYQIRTHQDSTQVKQPIFFKDGHVQLSSGADNSLIPTLDYQAKTSNSYVMDLMKTNTRYTMKAKSASGTFTIDGTSYGAGTNGTFTTPSSMTNKLLVMSNNANEEVMIIEGDVTDKTIPYFKGIKSAFEGEDKIEVLSTNRNLWTGADNYANSGAKIILHNENECIFEHHSVNNGIKVKVEDYEYQTITMSYDFEILDGKALNVGGHNRHETKAFYIDGVKVKEGYHNGHVATYQNNRVYHVDHVVHINLPMGQGAVAGEREHIGIEPNRYSADTPTYCKMRVTNFQIALGNVIKEYEPPKSNNTKIPLLSPLRSLPNGVCDELIIDRMKNKATLIQRVGELIHYGQGGTVIVETKGEYHKYGFYGLIKPKQNSYSYNSVLMCDTFMWNDNMAESQGEKISSYKHSTGAELRYVVSPHKAPLLTESYFRDWLSQNPVTVYYELETPIVTEIDLTGYPYIYKDGHIFLNTDLPVTFDYGVPTTLSHQIDHQQVVLQSNEKRLSVLEKSLLHAILEEEQARCLLAYNYYFTEGI